MGGCHAGEMRGATCGSDDHLDSPSSGLGGVLCHVIRCAVGRGNLDLGDNAECLLQELEARDEGLKVTV